MYAMTAAHKSLPLSSYAKVTNLKNHRSVVVRINDRGSFHGKRDMDLSYAAAKQLGIKGLGSVEITPLSRNEALSPVNNSGKASKRG
jgi:rare lipoprotein A